MLAPSTTSPTLYRLDGVALSVLPPLETIGTGIGFTAERDAAVVPVDVLPSKQPVKEAEATPKPTVRRRIKIHAG
jgi:hypothetical protein